MMALFSLGVDDSEQANLKRLVMKFSEKIIFWQTLFGKKIHKKQQL